MNALATPSLDAQLVAAFVTGAFKKCSCGVEHSRAQWDELALVGVRELGGEVFEMRNCVCGSTLAIIIGNAAANDDVPPTLRSPK